MARRFGLVLLVVSHAYGTKFLFDVLQHFLTPYDIHWITSALDEWAWLLYVGQAIGVFVYGPSFGKIIVNPFFLSLGCVILLFIQCIQHQSHLMANAITCFLLVFAGYYILNFGNTFLGQKFCMESRIQEA